MAEVRPPAVNVAAQEAYKSPVENGLASVADNLEVWLAPPTEGLALENKDKIKKTTRTHNAKSMANGRW